MTDPMHKESSGASTSSGEAVHTGGAESLEDCQRRVTEIETQLKDKENRYLYLYADFENFKKRAIKERSDLQKFGWEPVARDLLQVVDNLERAMEHVPADEGSKTLREGLQMVLDQFRSVLKNRGVEAIETHHQTFDPNLHEAVGQEPSELPSGTVSKEYGRGYTLHGRLLRPARVAVSSGSAAASPGASNSGQEKTG